MIKYETRDDLLEILFANKISCEIGVFKGDFSKKILSVNPKELHLIDPFVGSFSSGDKDGENPKFAILEQEYHILKDYFKDKNTVYIHRGFSSDVLNNFEDSYFESIYIDGDHSYQAVKKDLYLSYNKVKNNGYIAAHDYCQNRFPGIVLAIDEFCKERKLEIQAITKDGCPSIVIKVNK